VAHHILPPTHGGQLRQIATRYGIHAEQLLDFSANINPAGPPSSVPTAIRRALEDSSSLAMYPDLELVELKQAVAEYAGVQPENIAIANGFVPLLESALRSLKLKRCLWPVPSFSEYKNALENTGVSVTSYHLSSDLDFRYVPSTILNTLLQHSCDAILLANPQNPSGTICDVGNMQRLIEMAAQSSITVLLDEAFIDYSPGRSLTQRSIEQANVIVFRSVTKFFAIPGLRVAYAVSLSSNVDAMNRFIAPWPIARFGSDGVCTALRDKVYAEESRLTNDRRRLWLEQELAGLNIATYPSGANFLLLRFSAGVDVSLLWEQMIVEEQIVLRSCANFEGLESGHLRIAVRSELENERLIRGLERVLPASQENSRGRGIRR
jgi:threonine-phosphate decarboxylase